MENKVIEETEKLIKEILEKGIDTNNLDYLYKLTKIKHMTKEDESMNYGNYGNYGEYNGRGPGRGAYGEYGRGGNYGEYGNYGNYGRNSYGRRGQDSRYRGYSGIDRMYDEYGRYSESRSNYGAGEETDKSFHYMVKALEDFIKVLYEEATSEMQKQQLRQALQESIM